MRRRLLLLTAAAVPFAITAVAHGCTPQQPFESACLWLADPNNCYREAREGMIANVGAVDNPQGDCHTAAGPGGAPTEVGMAPLPLGNPNGSFLNRAMLDVCFLAMGGQVVFDPPIDPTMIPAAADAGPVTYTIKIMQPDGNECGFATYTSEYGFSMTVNSPPNVPDAGDGGVYNAYGTYTQATTAGSDAFDVTCPSGETHHLNLDEVVGQVAPDGGATSSCPGFSPLLPSASLQIAVGGIDTPGAVSLAISYPPTPPVAYPSTTNLEQIPSPPLTPTRVVYFNCTVPAALEPCIDGVKDGEETDVDCGGPTVFSKTQPGGTCPARCVAGQQCLQDSDCAGTKCAVVMGMRVCM
jgi:hypothetical protein